MNDSELNAVLAKAYEYMREQSYPEAITLCKETVAALDGEGSSQENERRKMHILFCLSDICHTSGNWVDGLMYLSTVIHRATELSESDILAEAIIRSGDIHSKMGNWKKALDKYGEAEKQVRKFKNKYLLGRVHVGRGTVHWRQGKYQKAMADADEANSIALETDNQRLLEMATSLRASICFDTRDYDRALEESDIAIKASRTLGDDIETARILNNKGEVHKVMGDYEPAIGIFTEALEMLANTMNFRSLAYLYTNLAECQARKGDIVEARKAAATASKMVNMSQDKYVKSQFLLVSALIEHAEGQRTRALGLLREAESIMRKLGIPYDMGVLHLEHARMLRDSDSILSKDEYRNAIRFFTEANNAEKVKLASAELAALGN